MMLSLDTAYRSFGGEVEASSTPTICRPPDSRRHQLSALALLRIERGSLNTVPSADKIAFALSINHGHMDRGYWIPFYSPSNGGPSEECQSGAVFDPVAIARRASLLSFDRADDAWGARRRDRRERSRAAGAARLYFGLAFSRRRGRGRRNRRRRASART